MMGDFLEVSKFVRGGSLVAYVCATGLASLASGLSHLS